MQVLADQDILTACKDINSIALTVTMQKIEILIFFKKYYFPPEELDRLTTL